MIALIGKKNDETLSHFAMHLQQHNVPSLFLDQQLVGKTVFIRNNRWHFPHCKQTIDFDDITGVFNRVMVDPLDIQDQQCAAQIEKIIDWLDLDHKHIVNRPKAMLSNSSKPYQLDMLGGTCLKTPDYQIVANRYFQPCFNDAIYKSISGVRSIVQPLDTDKAKEKASEPVIIQPHIPGDNIRVHVVGNTIFSQKIISDNLDYRYSKTPNTYQNIKLTKPIENACLKVAKRCQLSFAGIDLIQDPNDAIFTILEVNPSPGYAYFEKRMDKPEISNALVNFLQGYTI